MTKAIFSQFALAILIAGCAQEYSQEHPSCPCDDGWKCCLSETAVDICVRETASCPCVGFIGEMTVTPESIPSSGSELAEVVAWVFDVCGGKRPQSNIIVTFQSSRNLGNVEFDYFEQPTGPTDSDGRVVGYISSFTPGEVILSATADLETLCDIWNEAECIKPLEAVITFSPDQ